MPRELFQNLEPKRTGSGWRSLPASLAVHALAGIALAAFVVRPVANAIEEHRAGVLRFPGAVATPAPVAVPAKSSSRAKPRRAVAAPVPAPAPAPISIVTPDLEDPAPGAYDDAPPGCLTGCGNGPPDSTGAGLGDGRGSVDTTNGSGRPLPIGGELRPPRKTHQVLPQYPELARKAGVGAVVIVQCVIDVQGRVSEARVLRGHPLLDSSALEAVRQWRYEPTRLNGTAVPVVMTVTVTFQPRS